MFRKLLLASAALALASTSASAGTDAIISNDHMVTMAPHGAMLQLPLERAGKKNGVFNNLATKYKEGLYWCCTGATITGSQFKGGYSYEQGIPFTPTKNVSVTSITMGLGYVSGTNAATIALYSDSSGLPGTELASGAVSNMPKFPTCCTTTAVTISSTALTAGTQYWIVVSASGTTWVAWNYSTVNTADAHTYAYNYNGDGWVSTSYPTYAGAEVK